MLAHRLALTLLILAALVVPGAPRANERESPETGDQRLPPVLLIVRGRALLPDGSPAVGATASAFASDAEPPVVPGRTDAAGEFQIRGVFGYGCRLHVSLPDGTLQATHITSAGSIRQASAKRLELKLQPPAVHEVLVVSGEVPVEDAHVVAEGIAFQCRGVTGRDGKVELQLPAGQCLQGISVWHPTLGVTGWSNPAETTPKGPTRVSLHAPSPYSIRVVDADGKGVGGLDLSVLAWAKSATQRDSWFFGRLFDEGRVQTDSDGAAVVPWVPRNVENVSVRLPRSNWKIDAVQDEKVERIARVQVRRLRPFLGRLVVPAGVNPEGILVTGPGLGRSDWYVVHARARRDGFFMLPLAAEDSYVLGIADVEWACKEWGGTIPKNDLAERDKLVIPVIPATPLMVRVTRGADRTPAGDVSVVLSNRSPVEWIDTSGNAHSINFGVQEALRTDPQGEIRAGVGEGRYRLQLSSRNWSEEREFDIASGKPVVVEFHRDE